MESDEASRADITRLVHAARDGNRPAMDALFEALYEELRALARRQRGRWKGDYTLNTTALVHEAYLKLVDQTQADWRDRAHFCATAARAMRHILVNYAERRMAAKRGGGATPLPLADDVDTPGDPNPVPEDSAEEILALHDALQRLERLSERQSRVVECRFFVGLPIPETAEVLGVSPATVKRDWHVASAWLHREIRSGLPRWNAWAEDGSA
jgi:RNA polymerase sigma factor (TIGR02999 family)